MLDTTIPMGYIPPSAPSKLAQLLLRELEQTGDNPIVLASRLATLHSSRIYYIRMNALPADFMDRTSFEFEELMGYIKMIQKDINKATITNDTEKVMGFAKDLLMLILLSILSDGDEKAIAKQLWQTIIEYAEEAYLIYLDKFNWYLNEENEITTQLKATLRGDFFKTPAALSTA